LGEGDHGSKGMRGFGVLLEGQKCRSNLCPREGERVMKGGGVYRGNDKRLRKSRARDFEGKGARSCWLQRGRWEDAH